MKCNNSDGSWGLISKAVGHLPNFNNVSVPKIRNTVNYLLNQIFPFSNKLSTSVKCWPNCPREYNSKVLAKSNTSF